MPCPSRRILILLRGVVALALIAGSVAAVWFARSRAVPGVVDAALAAYDGRDTEELERILERVATQPEQVCAPLVRGMLLLCQDRAPEAVLPLQQAADVAETRFPALALLGEALYRSGRFLEAREPLLAVLARDPGQLTSRRLLASTYYDLGAMQLAVEQLEIIAGQDVADARPKRLQGLICKDLERFPEAIDAYVESLRRDPKQSDLQQILLELAACQVGALRFADAEATLAQSAASADSLALRAECSAAFGRADVEELLTEALRRDGNQLRALLLVSQRRIDAGDLGGAAEHLRRATAAHPAEFKPRYLLASVLSRMGEQAAADRELGEMRRVQDLRRQFTDLHEQALVDLGDAELRYRLATVARELGMSDMAKVWVEATLAINPEHAGARKLLRSDDGLSPPRGPGE